MGDLIIRPAAESDSPTIAAIYNHYVRTSTATFDTEERTLAGQVAWLDERGEAHPVLVAEKEGQGVLAWGALSPFRSRGAWRHTVEISAYVAPDAAGQRIGLALSEMLIVRARELGHHAIVSQIVHENGPSLSMARRLGFVEVGTLTEVGRKFDRWLDVVLMEIVLGPVPADGASS
jgi:L-amino acid N-acyltransferase